MRAITAKPCLIETMPDPNGCNNAHNTPQQTRFTTTHWSVVAAAGHRELARSAAALEILCSQYWPPVHAFILRRGHRPDDAKDLTQEFFARLLEKNWFESADVTKGRFRTFLLTAVTRFLINERERAQTLKRGGRCVHLSVDFHEGENHIPVEPMDAGTPEKAYDRRWAETVLETVLTRLQQEYESSGERGRFEILKPSLWGDKQPMAGVRLAAQLGIAESSAYSAVSRIRSRYGELLREEIAHTVNRPEEIEEELRYLVHVLSS